MLKLKVGTVNIISSINVALARSSNANGIIYMDHGQAALDSRTLPTYYSRLYMFPLTTVKGHTSGLVLPTIS
jgi:hypothetical protein